MADSTDRLALAAAQDAWAAARVAPPYVPAPVPDHAAELLAAHEGRPSIETQSATHGAPLPPVDRGSS